MIIFKPTSGFLKKTDLDFKIINTIFNTFISTPRKVTIKVECARSNYSAFYFVGKRIAINTRQGTSLRYVISTLLHEIRHYFQIANFRDHIQYHFPSYNAYYNSPEERDARKFEKLTREVCKIYTEFKSIETKIKLLDLDNFPTFSKATTQILPEEIPESPPIEEVKELNDNELRL